MLAHICLKTLSRQPDQYSYTVHYSVVNCYLKHGVCFFRQTRNHVLPQCVDAAVSTTPGRTHGLPEDSSPTLQPEEVKAGHTTETSAGTVTLKLQMSGKGLVFFRLNAMYSWHLGFVPG